jgi:S-disulfanyl-L-cysteine oxidoreductase SoxD
MRTRELCIAAFALLALAGATRAQAQGTYGIGRTATPAEIAGWNIDIDRDGSNLPPGSGSVSHGHEVFDQQCASCHGAKGEGGLGDRLVGGQGTIATPKPVRTVGSFGPTPQRCSIISAAPCRRTRRSHLTMTTSMRFPPTSSI